VFSYYINFLTHPKPANNNNNNNKTSDNPVASATMKNTGISLIAILLVLLASLTLVYRRK